MNCQSGTVSRFDNWYGKRYTYNMKFDEWLKFGIEEGWVTEPYCNTHDGGYQYMGEEELEEWEAGGDPCCVVIRVMEGQ